jgi:hypothetical protein
MEKDRIFVSSLAANRSYEEVLDFLSHHHHASREELHKAISGIGSTYAGGSFSGVLEELVDVGFVEKYAPLTVANARTSHVARYAIADEYLQFFYRFIEAKTRAIDAGKFSSNPSSGLNRQDFNKLMGFSFERWCRKNEALIARHMKFGGVVDYLHGAWYERSSPNTTGLQIDLMYIRKDSKIILCEIKYNSDAPVNRKVIKEVQEKLDRFIANNSRYRRHTLETALITAEPIPEKLAAEGFFTYLITAEDLLASE